MNSLRIDPKLFFLVEEETALMAQPINSALRYGSFRQDIVSSPLLIFRSSFFEKVRFHLRIANHAYTKDVSETLSLETFVEFSTGPSDTGNDYE